MTERDPAAATRVATRRLVWLLVVPVLLLLAVLTMLQLHQLRADALAQIERRVDERARSWPSWCARPSSTSTTCA
jgi:hypothetical protein